MHPSRMLFSRKPKGRIGTNPTIARAQLASLYSPAYIRVKTRVHYHQLKLYVSVLDCSLELREINAIFTVGCQFDSLRKFIFYFH